MKSIWDFYMQNYYNHVKIQNRKHKTKWQESIKTIAPKQYSTELKSSHWLLYIRISKKNTSTKIQFNDYAKNPFEKLIGFKYFLYRFWYVVSICGNCFGIILVRYAILYIIKYCSLKWKLFSIRHYMMIIQSLFYFR